MEEEITPVGKAGAPRAAEVVGRIGQAGRQIAEGLGWAIGTILHGGIALLGLGLIAVSLVGWGWYDLYWHVPVAARLVEGAAAWGQHGIVVMPQTLPTPPYNPFVIGVGLVLVARLLAGFGGSNRQ